MAGKIRKLFKLASSRRGYRLYRFGDTDLGVRAANFGIGTRLSGWTLELTFLKNFPGKKPVYATTTNMIKVSTPTGSAWRDYFLDDVTKWINKNQAEFFDFVFSKTLTEV